MSLRMGIIGTGMIVREFLPELVNMDGMEVVSVMGSPSGFDKALALSREYGIASAARDLDGLCVSGIDTVYVAVPNSLHYFYCKAALERGLNVIVEKPMTDSAEKAEELAKLAEKKELFLFEAITTIYMDGYEKIREWLPRIGDVRIVESRFCQYSSRYDNFKKGIIAPAFDPEKSGGALMDLNVYNIHYITGLFGAPKAAVYYPNIERRIDTSGVLILNYPEFSAVLTASKDSGSASGGLLQGTLGCIRSTMTPNMVGNITLELRDGTLEVFEDPCAGKRMLPEFRQFIRAISENDHVFGRKQLQHSLTVIRILDRARKQTGLAK